MCFVWHVRTCVVYNVYMRERRQKPEVELTLTLMPHNVGTFNKYSKQIVVHVGYKTDEKCGIH